MYITVITAVTSFFLQIMEFFLGLFLLWMHVSFNTSFHLFAFNTVNIKAIKQIVGKFTQQNHLVVEGHSLNWLVILLCLVLCCLCALFCVSLDERNN